jgi:hypothetical protein
MVQWDFLYEVYSLMVFWVLILCSDVVPYQCCGGPCCHLLTSATITKLSKQKLRAGQSGGNQCSTEFYNL